jgi:hypothetical protein
MTSDSRLSFEVSSISFKNEGLSFVSMAVEEETEIRSDLRRFAESLRKGFVLDKGFAPIFHFITDLKKGKRSQVYNAQDFFSGNPRIDGSTRPRAKENRFPIETKTSSLMKQRAESMG